MKRSASILALALFTLAAVGSGSSDEPPATGSAATPATPGATPVAAEATPGRTMYCDASGGALGQCIEYPLSEASGEDAVREQCTSMEGTLSETACPTEGRIGTCTPNLGHNVRYYYATQNQYTAGSASAECSALRNGTWAAN